MESLCIREEYTLKRRATWLILVVITIVVASVNDARAQTNALTVVITRPGEGETLYSSPTAPFARVPVTGWVSADNFDVAQLQVRLEILQGTKLIGSLTTAPQADGAYSFEVAINSNPLSDLANVEKGCQGTCHALMPFSLPSGVVLLRATVTDPLGKKAIAERRVVVDQSGYADVPVQVVVADHPGQNIQGLRVVASTRLYDWRAREYSATTDASGRAVLHLEALGQAPTRYLLRVEARVINGILYVSPTPLPVVFPPGTTIAALIELKVASQYGRIDGTIDPKGLKDLSGLNTLTIRAIQVPSGAAFATKTAQGKFSLVDLPIAKYWLVVDEEAVAAQSAQAAPQPIDLTSTSVVSATLQLAPAHVIHGVVRDSDGNPIPLAWVAMDEQGKNIRVSASSGEFVWYGLPTDAHALWITAPGYWRHPVALDSDRLDIMLAREPETRVIPWGNGAITLPPETIATLAGNRLALKRGWVWGKGTACFRSPLPTWRSRWKAASLR